MELAVWWEGLVRRALRTKVRGLSASIDHRQEEQIRQVKRREARQGRLRELKVRRRPRSEKDPTLITISDKDFRAQVGLRSPYRLERQSQRQRGVAKGQRSCGGTVLAV